MKKPEVIPKDLESPFAVNEMFFSSTDLKGIIQTGNDVFARVSKYHLNQLIGKPHNIIRHPDMPRVIFKLLWDYIKSGKKIVAYVKNMAKDGSYYWVLATVFPVFDNEGNIIKYLSIRIKPTSKYFKVIPDIYKEVLEIEKQHGMEKALEVLNKKIKDLGFKNYDDFMITVFIQELKEKIPFIKSKNLSSENSLIIDINFQLEKILDIFKSIENIMTTFHNYRNTLIKSAENISTFTEDIRIIALNASVESLRLGSLGIVFSVLAQEMRKSAENSAIYIKKISNTIEKSSENIKQIIFNIGITNLQILMLKDVLETTRESVEGFSDNMIDFKLLMKNSFDNLSKNEKLLNELTSMLENILSNIEKVLSTFEKLEFLHVNGKIESAHLNEFKFSIIFNQVKELVTKSQQSVIEIQKPTEEVLSNIISFKENIVTIKKHLDIAIKFLERYLDLPVGSS